MDIISDYANWKFENYTLIDTLEKDKSAIIQRFSHVIAVCDYYYKKVTDDKYKLNRDEEVIFDTAFNYVHDHFETISLLLKQDFNSHIEEMEKCAKTINLLLYINDFQNELSNSAPNDIESENKLNDLESRVLGYIETRTNAPDEMFQLLSDVVDLMFADGYEGVNEILYEVAEQLQITPDEDSEELEINY